MSEITTNQAILNQIYSAFEQRGLNRSELSRLKPEQLELIWNQMESGANVDIEQVRGWILEAADENPYQESSIEKNERTFTDANGDKVTESFDGDVIAKKVIEHQEESKTTITTILYSGGAISSKKVAINGNTVSDMSYTKVDGKTVITSEDKSARKTTTTTVLNIDQDGNYSDEDFVERTTTSQLSGQSSTVSLKNGKITVIGNGKETVYDGASISEFDNGNLKEYTKPADPSAPKKYMSTKGLMESLPEHVELSLITDENTQKIVNFFKLDKVSMSTLDKMEMNYIRNFISEVVDSNSNGTITDVELEAMSQYLQEQGIENANFKSFLENLQHLKSDNNSVKTLNPTSSGRHVEVSEMSGDKVARLVDAGGNELRVSYYAERGAKVLFKDYATYDVGGAMDRQGVIVTPKGSRLASERVETAYSPRYQQEIEDYLLNYFIETNKQITERYDDARGEFSVGDWVGDRLVDFAMWATGDDSPSAEEIAAEAEKMMKSAGRVQSSMQDEHTYKEFKEKFILEMGVGNFNYLAAEKFMRISNNYVTAKLMQSQIDIVNENIEKLEADIESGTGPYLDPLKVAKMKSYGIEIPADSKDKDKVRQCVYMYTLCEMVGDKDVAKVLVDNVSQEGSNLTNEQWLDLFKNLKTQFETARDNAIHGTDDARETTYHDKEGTQLAGLKNNSIEELEQNYKAAYKAVFGVSLKDEDMEKLLKAGSIVGNFAVNIALCVVSGAAAAALVARGATLIAGISTAKNLSTGGKILYHGVRNLTEFAIDDGMRFATYGSKARRAMMRNMSGDFLHIMFANHIGGPVGKMVGGALGKQGTKILRRAGENTGNVLAKTGKLANFGVQTGAAEGAKAGGYSFLYTATGFKEYSEYRAVDILKTVSKDKKLLAAIKPADSTTLYARAIDNMGNDNYVKSVINGLTVVEYDKEGTKMFALADASKNLVFESQDNTQVLQGLIAMCIEAASHSVEMSDMRFDMQNRVGNINHARQNQYQAAASKIYYPRDIEQLSEQNQTVRVHDGYVYSQKPDGSEEPLGIYYAQAPQREPEEDIVVQHQDYQPPIS